MFEFQYPEVAILALMPFVIYFFVPASSDSKRSTPTLINPNIKQFAKFFGKRGVIDARVKKFNFLLYVIWLLTVLSLMHPQNVEKLSKTKTRGYDIMLAIDLSRSMLALDFSDDGEMITRLQAIKNVATKFILDRKGDRVGLVFFGDNAYLQTPLTSDLDSAAAILEMTEIGMAGDATAMGDGIALSVKALRDRPENSRVIILLTDGTNTAGVIKPEEGAKIAKEYGIKIYSIGVGKNGVVPFPTESGRIVNVRVEMDERKLKDISKLTNGSYFHAEDDSALKQIYKKINEMEKSESETTEIVIRKQLFIYPLSIALLILGTIILLNFNWGKLFKL